jgi:hypothetical protein
LFSILVNADVDGHRMSDDESSTSSVDDPERSTSSETPTVTCHSTRLMQRLPDLRMADETVLPLRPTNFVSDLEAMPMVFTPTRPVTAV